MLKALVTTVPFASFDPTPMNKLRDAGIEVVLNPLERRLQEYELADMIGDFDVVIAGTEPITEHVLSCAPKLKLISRVGIGLDGVDLLAARDRGIAVTYTPDAPSAAVADLTIGLAHSLIRKTHIANAELHRGQWIRHFGRRMEDLTVGVIGVGRIGSKVVKKFLASGVKQVLAYDIQSDAMFDEKRFSWSPIEKVLKTSDVITFHVPLTLQTKNMVTKSKLLKMKQDAVVINTSRGGIINERDLCEVLLEGHLSGAAIDVFEREPYDGPLANVESCLMTAHMGSMTFDCRARMELEASEEVVRFSVGKGINNIVPSSEFEIRELG